MAVSEKPEIETIIPIVLSALSLIFLSIVSTSGAPVGSRVNVNSTKYVVPE